MLSVPGDRRDDVETFIELHEARHNESIESAIVALHYFAGIDRTVVEITALAGGIGRCLLTAGWRDDSAQHGLAGVPPYWHQMGPKLPGRLWRKRREEERLIVHPTWMGLDETSRAVLARYRGARSQHA